MTTQQEKSHDDGSFYCPECGCRQSMTAGGCPHHQSCTRCHQHEAMHWSGSVGLCCWCHMETDGVPADWHSVCMRIWNERQGTHEPVATWDETLTPQTEPVAPAPTSSSTPDWRLVTYDRETDTASVIDGRLFYITSGASSAIAALEKPLLAAESLDDPGLYHRLAAIVAALRAIAAGGAGIMGARTISEVVLTLEQAAHDLSETAYLLSGIRGDATVPAQLIRLAEMEAALRGRAAWYLDNDEGARVVLGRQERFAREEQG